MATTRARRACPPRSTHTTAHKVIRSRPKSCTREQTQMHHTLTIHQLPHKHHITNRFPMSPRPHHHTQHISLHSPHPEPTPLNFPTSNHTPPTRLSQLTPPSSPTYTLSKLPMTQHDPILTHTTTIPLPTQTSISPKQHHTTLLKTLGPPHPYQQPAHTISHTPHPTPHQITESPTKSIPTHTTTTPNLTYTPIYHNQHHTPHPTSYALPYPHQQSRHSHHHTLHSTQAPPHNTLPTHPQKPSTHTCTAPCHHVTYCSSGLSREHKCNRMIPRNHCTLPGTSPTSGKHTNTTTTLPASIRSETDLNNKHP